ncbi:carboxymuconolactone decarboxylase family protein [Mycolicibacterium baixiangningiae]|uniref:carboxymuconolactone decarboxylase family protein n=1 Tax=Mycolicibacterium baixiangningiae TaxID=2761578 RepID=UPI0018D0A80E|nr:carboxymuconolactone decarboxylase family protein [Mycolicibacterium baixiangningiae]
MRDPDQEQRQSLSKTMHAPDGTPVNVFATLVHQPQLMRRVNALGGYFMAHGSIALRDRELVILRVAGTCDGVYEEGQHRWIAAEKAGLSAGEIEAAIDPERPHTWSADDGALLVFVDEVLASGTVSDPTWASLDSWGDVARTELLVLIGFYRMLAIVTNALDVELDPSVADVLERQGKPLA